jgi:hypothetical protein
MFCIQLLVPPIVVVTDSQVRLRLAEEDNQQLERGERLVVHDDVTPSMLILQGLELEELQ